MMSQHKKDKFSGIKAGVFALLVLLIVVGGLVWLLISSMGVEWFDSGFDAAKPYISSVRYAGYVGVIIFWKKVAGLLSNGNQELYLELLKRRKQLVGIIVLAELLLIHKLFIF